jgi:ankyrin repeat protein
MAHLNLPPLPADHVDWISHVAKHPDTSLQELIEPYKEYDSKLREVFAQQPDHPAIAKPNVVPIFAGREQELKIRARDMEAESKEERECHLMPLKKADRKANNTPAVVQSLKEFQTNFQLFSESSLVDMDWSNVVCAGSAVVTSLLPVRKKHSTSKRALREYYHQILAPASDVDLFLYDLTEEQAVEKIKQIEQRIRDSILTETTTVRTKNAITIVSQYPTRHVQIVLRIYRSISEILTGFDVDCSCAAYDGSQVYASPRALAAYMTQVNTIDLSRRSPSYENRLSKYSRRGFEIYWPLLERSRIDPTLFERSFGRTLGLARLLVLERLPKNTDREAYVDQRRAERGRPAINRYAAHSFKLQGNIKEEHDDEIAEWVETDEVSDYHTFTIPYGPKYHARKIERLLYAKDLLLNAEWNRPKERETVLHRHPAFFGNATDVIGDCCGYCPKPSTPEDKEIAEEEDKIYVSGDLQFIKDNPGRQAIGSFNPLTDDDWTEMAYVGNTARLCQAIVDGDLEHVQDWLKQEGADPNRRDYTGRTPLHLAVMTSTPAIVQALIDGGARIVARVVDGKTALHLAAMRGEVEMVKALLIKSEANEELEEEKASKKKAAAKADEDEKMVDADSSTKDAKSSKKTKDDTQGFEEDEDEDGEDSDVDMLDDESENVDATTENSIVKIDRKESADNHENLPENASDDEPDVYDIDVLAWDTPVSALHLAIANGHTNVVKTLVQDFGADVLLPIKLVNDYNKSARAAILPIVLALQLSAVKAKEMTEALISLGASPAQADLEHVTALQYFTAHGVDLLKVMVSANRPAAQRAVGHLSMSGSQYSADAKGVLQTAIDNCDAAAVDALLELGAKPEIDFGTYMTSFKSKWDPRGSSEDNEKQFRQSITQPVFSAVYAEMTEVVSTLLDAGANVNSLTREAWRTINSQNPYGSNNVHSLLDAVHSKIKAMRQFVETGKVEGSTNHYSSNYGKCYPPIPLQEDAEYLKDVDTGSYKYFCILIQIESAKENYKRHLDSYNQWEASKKEPKGTEEKRIAVQSMLTKFQALESQLLQRDAKTFEELYPDVKLHENQPYNYNYGGGYEPPPPKPWSPLLTFDVPDMTDARRAAYVKLFQACWDGDLATIKELTLAVWGDNQTPLQIALTDSQHLSPFSIAVVRKHFDIARAILEIAHAQYAPEEKVGQLKHSLQPTDEDEDDFDRDDDDVQIYSEIVDDRFTIENIGEVQSQVKSKVTPLKLVSWTCPVWRFLEGTEPSPPSSPKPHALTDYQNQLNQLNRHGWSQSAHYNSSGRSPWQVLKHARNGRTYHVSSQSTQEQLFTEVKPQNLLQFAIYLNDADLLHFLIAMGEDYTARKVDTEEENASKFFRFAEADFLYAVGLGRVELLKEIITRTGSGIPLDDLVKKSGIEIPEKPKFYQGLSVHGQKRADWANAGREVQTQEAGESHPPLLHAARSGSLASVELFSSDAALRCYSEFADNHRDDIRIQNLAKSQGGLESAITKWLSLRSHLLIHCVVLGKTNDENLKLLRHLCKTQPEALEHRSASGLTPLHLAFRLGRIEMIKVLIEAGAQQTCRNNLGANIVHSIIDSNAGNDDKSLQRIRGLLNLIDIRLLPSLFTERTTEAPGAATPLARFTHSCSGNVQSSKEDVLKLLLEFSSGDDLAIISGEGDTPLHAAARYGSYNILRLMLERRPDLLFRENATGRTPYEIAEDAYLRKEIFSDPPSISANTNHYYGRNRQIRRHMNAGGVLNRQPNEFVKEPKDSMTDTEKVLEMCEEFKAKAAAEGNTKRKLVSLVEASEVAKRLAARKGRTDLGEQDVVLEGNEENVKGDEVDVWFWMGMQADN